MFTGIVQLNGVCRMRRSLILLALAISQRAAEREARHEAELAKKGIAVVPMALRRYNGWRDRTDTDRYYSDEYADKILRRATDPDVFVPIEIKLAATAGKSEE